MGDETQKFEIQIVSDADLKGYQQNAEAANKLKGDTAQTADATKLVDKATEGLKQTQAESQPVIEQLGLKHHDLHKVLHLIGRVSGPEAEAALASFGVAAGGGIGIALLAVTGLVEVLQQVQEEAEKAKEKMRGAFSDTVTQAAEAVRALGDYQHQAEQFWDKLNRTTAEKGAQNDFANKLKEISQVAGAAESAGLIDKARGDQFVNDKTNEERAKRAQLQDENVAALSDQLKRLQANQGGQTGLKDELDLSGLKADLANLQEAFKSGSGFTPKGIARSSVGDLMERWKGGMNDQSRNSAFESMSTWMAAEIEKREKAKQALQDHINLLQEEIEKRTADSQSLKDANAQAHQTTAVNDFAAGKVIADRLAAGGSVPAAQAQLLQVLEQAITGHKLTLDQAVRLIELQSQNTDVVLALIKNASGRIAAVNDRLQQLERQVTTSASQSRTG